MMEYVDPITESQNKLAVFWDLAKHEIEVMKCDNNTFKSQELPLARIKKIMKIDDEVKPMMISAEAPILFAKAAELFIREITLRAWIHTERNKRRTLQRSDIAVAVSDGETDQFDFLIDIVPREEVKMGLPGVHKTEPTLYGGDMGMMSNLGDIMNTGGAMTAGDIVQQHASDAPLVSENGVMEGSTVVHQVQQQQVTLGAPAQQLQQTTQPQIQYVLQLPSGQGSNNSGSQPIQIQMLPQQTVMGSVAQPQQVVNSTSMIVQQVQTIQQPPLPVTEIKPDPDDAEVKQQTIEVQSASSETVSKILITSTKTEQNSVVEKTE